MASQTSAFTQRPHLRARLLAVAACAIAALVGLTLTPWSPLPAEALLLARPVLAGLAVAAGLLSAFLLRLRARLLDEPGAAWTATGYALAAVAALLQAMTVTGFARSVDPFGTTASGVASLSLIEHLALPACVLLALAWPGAPRAWRVGITLAFLGWMGVSVTTPIASRLPDLVTAGGTFTALYRVLLVLGVGVAVVAAAGWIAHIGRRPTWTETWVALSLVLFGVNVAVHATTVSMLGELGAGDSLRLLALSVPAIGLLGGLPGLLRALQQHERSLAERLREELELARAVQEPRTPADAATGESVRAVLRARDLFTVFQPIVDLSTGSLVGLEALSRFPADPSRATEHWFADAAAAGLGADLELVALQEALIRLPEVPAGLYLAVNVSPEGLTNGALEPLLAADVSRLVVEITEHAAVDNYEVLGGALDRLRERGARVAVDDAGAGFASLRHIVRTAPEIVKLDVSLTRNVHADPVRRALTASLVSFAREIGARIVAEGIETQAELEVLRELGVPCGQGYLLARPAPLPIALRHRARDGGDGAVLAPQA